MDKKKLYAIIAVLVLICGGMGWYFMYYTKTPTYSLNLIREAVQKHDVQSFKQHVELDRVLSRAVDDYISSEIEMDSNNNPFVGLMQGLVNMAKPMMINTMKETVLRRVEDGAENKGAKSDETSTHGKTPTAEHFSRNTGLDFMEFRGIGYEKRNGKIANLGIVVSEPELAENFTFDIKMSELNDNTWQAVEVTNFKEYMVVLAKERKKALKQYIDSIQPIINEMEEKNRAWGKKYRQLEQFKPEALNECNEIDNTYFDLLEKVPVPIAAQQLANLYKEQRQLLKERVEHYRQYKFTERDFSENFKAEKEIKKRIKEIYDSVKDIS